MHRQRWRDRPRDFNFRDVMTYLGLDTSNRDVNWAVGNSIRALSKELGVEPARPLTRKTASDPSVAAPHCIAHYPIEMFPDACHRIREMYGERRRQLSFFEANA